MASTSSSTNSSLFHRSLQKSYPVATGGSGVYLHTSSGDSILDGSSGAAVSSLGHGNREVIDAVCAQAQELAFAHTSFLTSDPAEKLAKLIIDQSDDAFSKALFLTSGSEAVESALKLARQYHLVRGEPQRVHFIGRKDSYHGNTLGALAAGCNGSRRDAFAPMLSDVFHHVNRCFYSADGEDLTPEAYEDALIKQFFDTFQRVGGPDKVAAVIVEPVVGATLGAVAPATNNYLPRLVSLCRQHGVLVIFDEVMCGMGRVGTYHAWQGLGGVAPDLQTIGKGLGAGYQPLSAVLIGPRVYEALEVQNAESFAGKAVVPAFLSGHTFQGHSMGCAGALAVQRIIIRDGLVDRSRVMGERLEELLSKELPPRFFALNGGSGSLRGLGLFRAVDFGVKRSGRGGEPIATRVRDRAWELGAATYLCSSAVDAILLCPPFIITEDEMIQLARIVGRAVNEILP